MSEQVGEAVPASQRGSWTSFLKSIASFSGDLSSMTAPPFILSPVSLTEFPAYWCEHPDLFAAIGDAKDLEERALAVMKWFTSTLKGQYTSRNESMGSEKKPLNPVLGELFYGHWPAPAGSSRGLTTLLVEQVSHHPPITAYVIENKEKGLRLVGHNGQKTSFSTGSIIVRQIGHAVLTFTPPSGGQMEEYLITLPRLRIDGLWYGSPFIELTDSSYISGPAWVATIEYKGKGYFSGKSHQFKATLAPKPGTGGKGEYIADGTWHSTSTYTAVASGATRHKGQNFHNVEGPKEEVQEGWPGRKESGDAAADEKERRGFESRTLWKAVAKGIRSGDFDTASKEKTRIENEQRQRRKDEVAAGTPWELKHFKLVASDPIYERLGKAFKATPPTEECYEYLGNVPA